MLLSLLLRQRRQGRYHHYIKKRKNIKKYPITSSDTEIRLNNEENKNRAATVVSTYERQKQRVAVPRIRTWDVVLVAEELSSSTHHRKRQQAAAVGQELVDSD
jgi:hypothetical protein